MDAKTYYHQIATLIHTSRYISKTKTQHTGGIDLQNFYYTFIKPKRGSLESFIFDNI